MSSDPLDKHKSIDQVADRAAGELVAVDELGRAALPDREQRGQRLR
jgi:hypothetical protein